MSTILTESVTQTTPSSQPHSLNIVGTSQIATLTNQLKQDPSTSSSSSHKHPSYSMHSSLQTPPPTPRRSDGFASSSSHSPPVQSGQTRNYPKHLSFPTPRRLASPDGQGNYLRIEEKLTEYSPDFAGVPVDYVRSSIRRRGKKLYEIARSTTAASALQRSGPQFGAKQSDLMDSEMLPPTHVLIVYPLIPSHTSAPEFYPIHSIIPTLYCANFPSFPPSDNSPNLPQLPIRLPHPPSFKLLVHFLYTRNIQNIISYLLPVPWSSRRHYDYISYPTLPVPISLSALSDLVRTSAASLTSDDRWVHIDLLHGVYLNVVALGMYDLPLHGTRDEDLDSTGSGRKNTKDPNSNSNSIQREKKHGIERLNSEWGSTVLQNGTRDVDGRLLCICLIAMWEGLCRT